jgi:hypothetical protein
MPKQAEDLSGPHRERNFEAIRAARVWNKKIWIYQIDQQAF